MRRVTTWLGVAAATLTVVAAVLAFLTVEEPPASFSIEGETHTATVPEARWEPWPAEIEGRVIAYTDAAGEPMAAVEEPALYRHGFCAERPDLTRAFAGFVPTHGEPVRTLARTWGRAAAYDRVADTVGEVGPVEVAAGRADLTATVPDGRCHPERVRISVVRAGEEAFVLVRDLGVDGALTQDEAEGILDSVQ